MMTELDKRIRSALKVAVEMNLTVQFRPAEAAHLLKVLREAEKEKADGKARLPIPGTAEGTSGNKVK